MRWAILGFKSPYSVATLGILRSRLKYSVPSEVCMYMWLWIDAAQDVTVSGGLGDVVATRSV